MPSQATTQAGRLLHSVPEAAELLHVAPVTIRRAIQAGMLPHRRIGRRVLFTDGDLNNFVQACSAPVKKS
jgi:excisionase family DNA binding protein